MTEPIFKIDLTHSPSTIAQKRGIYFTLIGWYRLAHEVPYYVADGISGFDLMYTISGKGFIHSGENKIEVFPKTITILDTYKTHMIGVSPGDSWEFIYVHFDWKAFDELYALFCANGNLFYPNTPDKTEQDFRRIYALKENDDMRFELLSAQIVMNILMDFYNHCFESKHETDTNILMRTLLDKIKTDFANGINLSTLALETGYSKDHLNRLFKNYSGYAINEYIIKCKIEKAKKLLLYSTYSAKEIAFLCGFETQAYFSRIFKQKTGVNPTAYKQSIFYHYLSK